MMRNTLSYNIMGAVKKRRSASYTFLLYGMVLCSMLVIVSVANLGARPIPSLSFQNENPAERIANKALEITQNSDNKRNKPCLPYIFYDKPVKTGSTSVTRALADYIISTEEERVLCGNSNDCGLVAEKMCLGFRPPGHLIEHVRANTSIVNCLHDMGFYHVTSIREPKARILSVFKYNKATPGRHNGIDPDASFEEFLKKYPRCALYKYYDGLPAGCGVDKEAIEERAENIASRMDEVIELTEEPISDVHCRIEKFLRVLNVVPLKTSNASEMVVPDEVMEPEYVLYNKLKERRAQLAQQPGRMLCDPRRGNIG